jgi:CspA family cold shock protein
MTLKQATLTLSIALVLALAATLTSLSQLLPAPLAYFTIALVAAVLSLAIANSRSGTGSVAARSQSRATTAAGSPAPGPASSLNNKGGASKAGTGKELGKVKWFSASKGFGFITRDSGEDIFVHFRSINSKGNRVLREGQRVEFSIGNGSKGLQAEDVTALS